MITVRFCLSHYFHCNFCTMAWRETVAVQDAPPVLLKLSDLSEGEKTGFVLPVTLTDESLKSTNFGLLPRTELAKFIRLLGSRSVTTSPGRRFTLIFSVKKDVECISWDKYPSMEVLNGSMFLAHFAILEWLQRLGLKTSTLTLG